MARGAGRPRAPRPRGDPRRGRQGREGRRQGGLRDHPLPHGAGFRRGRHPGGARRGRAPGRRDARGDRRLQPADRVRRAVARRGAHRHPPLRARVEWPVGGPRGPHRQAGLHHRPARRARFRRRHQHPTRRRPRRVGARRAHRGRGPLGPTGQRARRGRQGARQQRVPAAAGDPHAAGDAFQRHLQPAGRREPLLQERLHHVRLGRQARLAPPLEHGHQEPQAPHLHRGAGRDRRRHAPRARARQDRDRVRSGSDRCAPPGEPPLHHPPRAPPRRRDDRPQPAGRGSPLRRRRQREGRRARGHELHAHAHRDVHGGGQRGPGAHVQRPWPAAPAPHPPGTNLRRHGDAAHLRAHRQVPPARGAHAPRPAGIAAGHRRGRGRARHPLRGAANALEGHLLARARGPLRARQRALRALHEPHPPLPRPHGAPRACGVPRCHRERHRHRRQEAARPRQPAAGRRPRHRRELARQDRHALQRDRAQRGGGRARPPQLPGAQLPEGAPHGGHLRRAGHGPERHDAGVPEPRGVPRRGRRARQRAPRGRAARRPLDPQRPDGAPDGAAQRHVDRPRRPRAGDDRHD